MSNELNDLTNDVIESPERTICTLTYSCYVYNRDLGMSAVAAQRMFKDDGFMEGMYQDGL